MALCVGNLSKTCITLLNQNAVKQLVFNASRSLYSPASMGMIGYMKAREYIKSQFHNIDHMFYEKMRSFVDGNEESMIFTEDLKTALHITEKKQDDLELVYKMIKKYKLQNNLRFSNFVFGPVVMRMLYHLDEPDLAMQIFLDPELDGFFDQLISNQLLMDMLYNHGRYEDVKLIYDKVKNKSLNGVIYPRNQFIILMAACYQENTPESLDYAKKIFTEASNKCYDFPRRSITFLGALALRQNDPSTALEAVALVRNPRYIDVRCIKVVAYIHLRRIEEILVQFREALQAESKAFAKQAYFKDTIEEVDNCIKRENIDENSELAKLVNQLKIHDYVQTSTLHEHICSTIESIKVVNRSWPNKNDDSTPNRSRSRFAEPLNNKIGLLERV